MDKWWYSLLNLSSTPRIKVITATISDGATIMDYQLFVNISYETGMYPNFTDVKFYSDCNSLTDELPYCLGSDCGPDDSNNQTTSNVTGSYTGAFVRLPQINSTFCMLYGNKSMTYTGDPKKVFDLWDDFDAASINASLWTITGGASKWAQYPENSSIMCFGDASENWFYAAAGGVTGKNPQILETTINTPSGKASECRAIQYVNPNTAPIQYSTVSLINDGVCLECVLNDSYLVGLDYGPTMTLPLGLFGGLWEVSKSYSIRLYMIDNESSTNLAARSFGENNGSRYYQASNMTTSVMYPGLSCYWGTWSWDYIRARRYYEPEPVYVISGPTWINVTFTPNTTLAVPSGNMVLRVYGNDTWGNIGEATVNFNTNPSAPPTPPTPPSPIGASLPFIGFIFGFMALMIMMGFLDITENKDKKKWKEQLALAIAVMIGVIMVVLAYSLL
jgi:hypothetical protein